jgi:hypothetical protein
MFNSMSKVELMGVNGGNYMVNCYKVVWQGHYYERVCVGQTWVANNSGIKYYLNGVPQYR